MVSNAACLLVTSKYEGTPNVVLEALFCGVPVIVSGQAGDAPLIIDKLGFGTTVEGVSARDFALALDKFVQNKWGQSSIPRPQQRSLMKNSMMIKFSQSGVRLF